MLLLMKAFVQWHFSLLSFAFPNMSYKDEHVLHGFSQVFCSSYDETHLARSVHVVLISPDPAAQARGLAVRCVRPKFVHVT